jgi:hypothetical protein
LKGHDFSRAENAAKSMRALAPEGMLDRNNHLIRGSLALRRVSGRFSALAQVIPRHPVVPGLAGTTAGSQGCMEGYKGIMACTPSNSHGNTSAEAARGSGKASGTSLWTALCPIHFALFAEWVGGSVAFLWGRISNAPSGPLLPARLAVKARKNPGTLLAERKGGQREDAGSVRITGTGQD